MSVYLKFYITGVDLQPVKRYINLIFQVVGMNGEHFLLMDSNYVMREDIPFDKDMCLVGNTSLKDDPDALATLKKKLEEASADNKDVMVNDTQNCDCDSIMYMWQRG